MSTGSIQAASSLGAKTDPVIDPKIGDLIRISDKYQNKKNNKIKNKIINGEELREALVAALMKGIKTTGSNRNDEKFLSLRTTINKNFNEINNNPSIHNDIKTRASALRWEILNNLKKGVEFAPDKSPPAPRAIAKISTGNLA